MELYIPPPPRRGFSVRVHNLRPATPMPEQDRAEKASFNPWVVVYRILVLALVASTLSGVIFAHTHYREFAEAFPGMDHTVFTLMMLSATVGIASLVGLWFWRRWAVWIYGLVGVDVVVLDVLARGPVLHIATAVVSTLVVLGLCYRLRGRFR
ncbi:MAG: hypothetical protein U0163_05795 [Gemmatimonadaceae bacterium]